ncbi:pentatricopeptide repeat-containing protein At5g55740, chloroplastic-like [Selaginella moellendorffii]|uniref:pentatricopeptide repeat-containing protein At5g55740, chloroplastic-like n=1 Tax=Selaginella moellendorffii TaxID=88036 RepID=UPI000D1C93B8|nr:pentatricopeptide repeat-containing protein At5g55740, chloroplastic-like [Selaginella moellendorffii]|eukprot:XP_024542093.1 pentatricopeptide repeat-containing protein At5g55740, chloroplastic-like [Selaginella moellendorffii]
MVAFRATQLDGIQPNSFTLVAIFQACATRLESREDDRVKALCNQAVESGLLASGSWNAIVATAVIGTYGKCGSVDKALEVFERTPRESRDVVAWNSIITVFVEQNKPELALKLFWEMQLEGEEPTRITLLKVLAAATASRDLGVGRLIHRKARLRSMDRDLVVGTALASMYSKLGRVEELLVERIEQGGRDLVCWNMIISALVQHSRSKEALAYFREMNIQGVKPDRVTLAPLISSATFPENESKMILCEISRSGLSSNAVISNAVLNFHSTRRAAGSKRQGEFSMDSKSETSCRYAAEGFAREAVILFHRMKQEGFQSSSVTSTVIFAAFSELHGLEEACRVVTVEENLEPASLWSLLISSCTQQGRSKRALEIFRAMQLQGMRVNRETLVPVIVSCGACSALREGRLIHQELQRSAPTILEEGTRLKNAMIDMYGRSGKLLDVAHHIFTEIKQPSVISWTAIVAAYAQNGRVEEATLLFHLMKLDGSLADTLTFTTILSMYSHAGLLEDGCHCFGSISRDHFLAPAPQHYNCMNDLLGRAGPPSVSSGRPPGRHC